MKLRSYDGSLTCALIASVIVVAIFFAALALALTAAFGADIDCLTKEKARAKWPGQWLYWHTAQRCWDNRKGGSVSYSINKNPMQLGKPPVDGNGSTVHHSGRPLVTGRGPTIFYPLLMSGGGTDDVMLRGEAMQTWPLIADFDADPPLFLPWQRMSGLLNR